MSKKKLYYLIIAIISLLGISITIYFFIKKEITEIPISFLENNTHWVNKELKKLSPTEKLEQLIFLETDSLKQINYLPGAIFYSGNSFQDFESLKNQFDSSGIARPIFANLFSDGFAHFNQASTPLNLNHFFANTDSFLLQNLTEFILTLNSGLDQKLHLFSLLNLLPNNTYDTTFYNDIIAEAIRTTKFSTDKKMLNGFWCNFEIKNLELDTLNYKSEIEQIKILIDNHVACLLLKKPSYKTIEYLRKNLAFGGLIISDFREYTTLNNSEIINLIDAGNSMFLLSKNDKAFRKKLLNLQKENDIDEKVLNTQVKKILHAKKWIVDEALSKTDSTKKLNYRLISRKLIENSISLIKNKDNLIPLKKINKTNCIYYFGEEPKQFKQTLENYMSFNWVNANSIEKLKIKNTTNLIILLNDDIEKEALAKNYKRIIENTKSKNQAIILNFDKVENLKKIDTLNTLIQIFGNTELEQDLVAQALMGGIGITGKLPEFHKEHKLFNEYFSTKKTRLKYSIPEEVGMDVEKLNRIDSLIFSEINEGTFPGCQVFVARKGVVVFNKSYGFHTYSKKTKVKQTDLYDLASLTKIAATTLAAMKMYDLKKIDKNTTLGDCIKNTKIDYTRIMPDTIIRIDTLLIREIPNFDKFIIDLDTINLNDSMIIAIDTIIAKLTPSRNIFKVKLSEMLVHQSGIMPVLPILPYLLYKIPHKRKNFRIKAQTYHKVNDSLRNEPIYDTIYKESAKLSRKAAFEKYYSTKRTDSSVRQIAKNIFFKNCYCDTLWIETKQLNVAKEKRYQYSDVNMVLVQTAIDSLNNESIDKFLDEKFYADLGLKNTCFLPFKNHSKKTITPTAYDKVWRNQMLHGYVHDPTSAILGGIAGNAGLFSNANELGIIFQMLLQAGSYGGKTYLKKETIDLFTHRQEGYSRGLGFELQSTKAIMSKYASKKTYGHTGFTGNCIWVDPENELVFVFVSNRVHPSSKNGKINSHRVRQNVHDLIYEAIK